MFCDILNYIVTCKRNLKMINLGKDLTTPDELYQWVFYNWPIIDCHIPSIVLHWHMTLKSLDCCYALSRQVFS